VDARTIGDLDILTPDMDPRDLDEVSEPPDDELLEAAVDGADWAGLRLGGTRVRLSHLVGVNLSESTWRGVTVYGCRIERADLSGARLTGLTMERCEFVGCRMTGAHIDETTLKNVIFEDCRLDYAILTTVRATGPVAWLDCRLDRGSLRECRLPSVAIRSCSLAGVELRDCDLRGADLRGSEVSTVDGLSSLRGVRLAEDQVPGLAMAALRELEIDLS
jgi:uncharacterized protein YjbI with pentapeptide repeats